MLFGSFRFLLGFYALGAVERRGAAAPWLAPASFAFYAFGDPLRNLAVLGASTAVNFLVGRSLGRRPDRRLLALGVAFDLAYLATFKYADVAILTLDAFANLGLPPPGIRLPVGVWFFTFTQVA